MSSEDVGVQSIPDHERSSHSKPAARLHKNRRLRLSRDQWHPFRRRVHRRYERSVTRSDTPGNGDRPVHIRHDPRDSRPTGCFVAPQRQHTPPKPPPPPPGATPCPTASGCSVAERTTPYPSRSSSVTIPSPPTTSTRAGAATCSASNRMAACGEVTTCSGATSNPNSRRCAATVLSLREALLVIYPTGIRTATFRRLSTASGMALAPAYTTPSRSANTASTPNSGVPATDAPPSRLSPRRAALSAPSASDTSPPLPSPCWLVPRSCLDARAVWFQPPTLTSVFPLLASALPPPSPPPTASPSTPPSTPTSPPPPSPSPPTPSPPSSSSSSPPSPISTMTTTSSDFNSSTSSARSAGSSHVEASPVLPSSVSTSA